MVKTPVFKIGNKSSILFLPVMTMYIIYFIWVPPLLEYLFLTLFTLIPIIICIAFYTLAERKTLAAIQRRLGPSIVGIWGLLQPFADGIKLIFKEIILPNKSNQILFIFETVLILTLSLLSWAFIPFNFTAIFINNDYSLLFLLTISSLSIYGIILGGWSSNSKYSFLGSLRSSAQMISYEVSLIITILPIILCSNSFNLSKIVDAQTTIWFFFPFFPLFIIFSISALAETNRAPFDLPEAEAELVAGFNVEYSSIKFALFFLGEYGNMILMSSLITLLFFGGWLPPLSYLSFIPHEFWFSFKTVSFCFLFVFIRGNLPRYRYDQLMNIGWKIFLPVTTGYLLFTTALLLFLKSTPIGTNLYDQIDFIYNIIL